MCSNTRSPVQKCDVRTVSGVGGGGVRENVGEINGFVKLDTKEGFKQGLQKGHREA